MTRRLENSVAIVTGAANGIGFAIARSFVAEGARVVLFDQDSQALLVATDAEETRGRCLAIQGDVTRNEDIARAVEQARAWAGGVDILVNNAGANFFYDPLEMPEQAWQDCLKTNLEGAWLFSREVLPLMVHARGGAIVNIASTHAFSVMPRTFPYPVAKHGLVGLTRALALDYGPHNVRVNAIAPGYIETRANVDVWKASEDPIAARKRVEELIPLRRIGSPSDVAMAAVYLASGEAAFTTGAVLTMDGGRSIVYHD